jgi:general secretion pathway protein G
LIELLVVLLVTAILLAIALPAIAGARKNAKAIACQSNLRSLATAVQAYASAHEALPMASFLTDLNLGRQELLDALAPHLSAELPRQDGSGLHAGPPFICPSDRTYGIASGFSYVYAPAHLMVDPWWLWDPYHLPSNPRVGATVLRSYESKQGIPLLWEYDHFHGNQLGIAARGGRYQVFLDGSVKPAP